MSLEARAREFCSGDIKKELGPWEAHQIAIRMATFAAPYEAALRELERKASVVQANWEGGDLTADVSGAFADLKQALASASELLEGGNDDQS